MKYEDFASKVKDMGYSSKKLDIVYPHADSRSWTAVLSPDNLNILVTYHVNRNDFRDSSYDVLTSKKQIIEIEPVDIFDVITNLYE